ncbi:Growth/differentiation factor 7 [Galemys pyrenaicus]|uniref:Growth/differentiation factor 7 n=1 Tax=Galemys pyrenaicus TaxID=202257 RepID=A0A8J6AXV6_GALPY|nr:Growth/differentiation factor 7 [Galemys pyrenaicus]
MDLSAAAALCLWLLSACRPRDGLEAAAVLRAAGAGPARSPGGGGGGGKTLAPAAGASAAPAAVVPGARAAQRAAGSGFRNGSVVPHQFMMSLYRSLAGRAPTGAADASPSGSGRHSRADTITGFADQATQGTHASSAPVLETSPRPTHSNLLRHDCGESRGNLRARLRRRAERVPLAGESPREAGQPDSLHLGDSEARSEASHALPLFLCICPSPADEPAAETGQSFLFDLSSLPDADEVVGAELRVLRRESPDPGPGSATPPPLMLLSTCPGAARAPRLQHSRAAEPLNAARWEVFDVAEAVRRHRQEPRATGAFCLSLRAVAEPVRSPLALRLLGFGSGGVGGDAAEERALLVVSSRTQRKDSLFREIRAQARALRAALTAEPPPDPGPVVGSPAVVIGGRRRRRTALTGARSAQGSGGGAGRGHGRRGRSRCSRKPLHVDFKELGWDDWIIAPLDYEAYHCEGVCDFPLRSHLEPTNHAIIQTLLNSMAPDAAPASCCVPARLSPISILYIDAANNVVYKQYEDMVVEACGCR